MKILVIGRSTRFIACSAKRAGYTVYTMDQFGDIDTLGCSEKTYVFGDVSQKALYEIAESFGEVDAVILGAGFEKLRFRNALNNSLKIVEEVSDKLKLAKKFESLGIPHPETMRIEKASELRFPLMVKPRIGSGGILNVMVNNEEELSIFKSKYANFIVQEFVRGIPCSVSLICSEEQALAIALNEQLIGIPWLTRIPFAYCGNITPFYSRFNDVIVEYAETIAKEFKLLGSNGVDFILTENGPVVIEVNPRFQGSLDTVELSTGINIFHAHVRSFYGELPKSTYKALCFAAKTIVFADSTMVIHKKISDMLVRCMNQGRAADIPKPGWVVHANEPITTFIEKGKSREEVLHKVKKSSLYIKHMVASLK